MQQDAEDCTFSPTINSSAKIRSSNDKRPFYLRLAEKGRRYSESLEKKRVHCRSFDENGKKMFVPTIIKTKRDAAATRDELSHSKVHSDGNASEQRSINSTTAAADEFLYLDAFEREERSRRRHRQVEAEAEVLANTRKMNSSSLVLLRRRAVSMSLSRYHYHC